MEGQKEQYWVVSDRVLLPSAEGATSPFALKERPVAVLVRGARIAELRPAAEVRAGFSDGGSHAQAPVYDVGASPLVPSWVNAHTHLAMAPLRGITSAAARRGNVISDVFFRIESCLQPQDVRAFTRLGAYESALNGCLFVFDHYYHGVEVARALRDVGLCGVVAPTVQDRHGPFSHAYDEQLQATLDIGESESYQACGIFAALGPHAGDTVSSALMQRIGELGRKHGLLVHLHLAQSWEEAKTLARSDAGVGAAVVRISEELAECPVLMAHGLHLAEQEIEHLVSGDWTLAYCPYSQLQFGVFSPVSSWARAGGRIVLGTDCVASNDALDLQRELPLLAGEASLVSSFSEERAAVLSGGDLKASEALERRRRLELGYAQFIEADRLMSAGDGRAFCTARSKCAAFSSCIPLSVGAVANFLILDEHHPTLFPDDDLRRQLAYGSTRGSIKWGVVAGRRVGQNEGWERAWLDTPEYRDALAEARRRKFDLCHRAGLS